MRVLKASAWSKNEIYDFLDASEIPLRLACMGDDGYPVICSLWFLRSDDVFWAVSHKKSHLVSLLKKNNKAGFEVAVNSYPYKGVRGQADIELFANKLVNKLDPLIERYLKQSNDSLASWLRSRSDMELAIKIVPRTINAWDYSNRMDKPS